MYTLYDFGKFTDEISFDVNSPRASSIIMSPPREIEYFQEEWQELPVFQTPVTMRDESSPLSAESKKIQKQNTRRKTSDSQRSNQKQRDTWKPDEDAQLLALFEQYGPKWSQIASMMGKRTGKQIRDRYQNNLRPDINREDWTREEEELLMVYHEKFGNKWAKIAQELPGRTENQIKNKFYCSKRKALKPINTSFSQSFSEIETSSMFKDKSESITSPSMEVLESP